MNIPTDDPGVQFDPDAEASGGYSQEEDQRSLFLSFKRIVRSGRRLAHGYATLAVLDMRRASMQLAWLIAAAVIIGLLVGAAWLSGLTALITLLLGDDMSWPGILLILTIANIIIAGLLFWYVRGLVSEAPFAATLRQLKGDESNIEEL